MEIRAVLSFGATWILSPVWKTLGQNSYIHDSSADEINKICAYLRDYMGDGIQQNASRRHGHPPIPNGI